MSIFVTLIIIARSYVYELFISNKQQFNENLRLLWYEIVSSKS